MLATASAKSVLGWRDRAKKEWEEGGRGGWREGCHNMEDEKLVDGGRGGTT